MNSFVFLCRYVGSFVLKGCVAYEKVVDCAETDEMLSTVISNTTSKTSSTIITCMLFDLFSYFSVPLPSHKYKGLVFKLMANSADIVVQIHKYKKIISDKLASWCVHVDDADNVFRVWNEFAFDGDFRNQKALVEFSNLHCPWILKMLYVHFSVLDNLICRTLTLSDTYHYSNLNFIIIDQRKLLIIFRRVLCEFKQTNQIFSPLKIS